MFKYILENHGDNVSIEINGCPLCLDYILLHVAEYWLKIKWSNLFVIALILAASHVNYFVFERA